VVLLEPYFTGSHRAWAEGYAAHSGHGVRIDCLPGRFWKWRMHGAAITLAGRLQAGGAAADVLLATDMLDVAAFRGLLRPPLDRVPVVLFFHENQFAYPPTPARPEWSASRRRRAVRRDAHYGFVNITSALAADGVWWNSAWNRDSFLAGARRLLGSMPDCREGARLGSVAERSRIMGIGLDLAPLLAAPPAPRLEVPRIVWNHRWEHDKEPDTFLTVLEALEARGVDFELVLLGERVGRQASPLPDWVEHRVVHDGYVESRTDYGAWLRSSDVVVSTATQEFFGAAVWEAVACGCLPVLPDRLAYPELLPPAVGARVLYRDVAGLVERLVEHLVAPDEGLRRRLAAHARAFDWTAVAARYDAALVDLAAAHAGPAASGL
jgi:glycosyltransferase involved in cell wall biosynthesis